MLTSNGDLTMGSNLTQQLERLTWVLPGVGMVDASLLVVLTHTWLCFGPFLLKAHT